MERIEGFSSRDRLERIQLLASIMPNSGNWVDDLDSHRATNENYQQVYEELSENMVGNYHLPFSVAPNFRINGMRYHVPMVTEESSVVAAAAAAAKFWDRHGGFTCRVQGTTKTGQVHFLWEGNEEKLQEFFGQVQSEMLVQLKPLTTSMDKRGGGIKGLQVVRLPHILPNYYQLQVQFDTADSMGANFINTVLESLAGVWTQSLAGNGTWPESWRRVEVLMCILSNYTPDCRVLCKVAAPVNELRDMAPNMDSETFLSRFTKAVAIAQGDPFRAVTHNKGIMNGVDAVVLATGNDFRAVEANAHAWASADGSYRSLSVATLHQGIFTFSLELPLAIGTVGGATTVHPMARHAGKLLGNPSAVELMQIAAAVGLANNYSAVKALVTSGIQSGHMQLHLSNIATQLGANIRERAQIKEHFRKKTVSSVAVKEYLQQLRHDKQDTPFLREG